MFAVCWKVSNGSAQPWQPACGVAKQKKGSRVGRVACSGGACSAKRANVRVLGERERNPFEKSA